MMEDNTQNIYQQQTLDALKAVVAQAATAREGTYSERNPLLGKMKRCPYCHQRRRENAQSPCCNVKYVVTAMQTDEEGNETIPMAPKVKGRKNPRLTRHRPPLFLMRQRLLDLEAMETDMQRLHVGILQDAVEGQVNNHRNEENGLRKHKPSIKWGHTPQVEIKPQHLAAFIEKVILQEIKLSAKRKRQMQKESRRRNRC